MKSSASHRGDWAGSQVSPCKTTSKYCQWNAFFSQYFRFLLSLPFHHCHIITFTLPLPFIRRKSGKSLGTLKKIILSDVQWQRTENNSDAYTVGFNSQHQDDYEYWIRKDKKRIGRGLFIISLKETKKAQINQDIWYANQESNTRP